MKFKIEYQPGRVYKYFVYLNGEQIEFFTTLWGAKRFIKKTIKESNKVDEYNIAERSL